MKFAVLFAAAGVAVFMTACGPKLAQTPYTAEETQWESYLKENYPGWRAPQTEPPKEGAAVNQGGTAPQKPYVVEESATVTDLDKEFEIVSDTTYSDGTRIHSDTRISETPVSKNSGSSIQYTVKKGDTLGSIAKAHYNKASSWKKIYNANTNVISDPNKLKIGTVLRIPQQ